MLEHRLHPTVSLRRSVCTIYVNSITVAITLASSILLSLIPSPVSGLQIEILSSSIVPQPPALVYHGEGDCEWKLLIIGTPFIIGSVGQRLSLQNSVSEVTCTVSGTILLNATVSITGKVIDDC